MLEVCIAWLLTSLNCDIMKVFLTMEYKVVFFSKFHNNIPLFVLINFTQPFTKS